MYPLLADLLHGLLPLSRISCQSHHFGDDFRRRSRTNRAVSVAETSDLQIARQLIALIDATMIFLAILCDLLRRLSSWLAACLARIKIMFGVPVKFFCGEFSTSTPGQSFSSCFKQLESRINHAKSAKHPLLFPGLVPVFKECVRVPNPQIREGFGPCQQRQDCICHMLFLERTTPISRI